MVNVNPSPNANVGAIKTICNGANTTIGASAVSGNTYLWSSMPAGFTSTNANPTVSPTTTTKYYLTETTTATGCFKSDSVMVNVNPLPNANVGAIKTICNGANTTIGASAVSGNTYLWSSMPAGFTSTNAIPTVSPTTTTKYYLTETTTATGCFKSDSVMVNVNPLPFVTTQLINSYTIIAKQNGAFYQWLDCNLGHSIIPGATNQSYTATINGDYAVIVSINNCTDTSTCVNINKLGMYRNMKDCSKLTIYPNPASTLLIVNKYNLTEENIRYSIMSSIGQVVVTGFLIDDKTEINISSIAAGVYIIKINDQIQQFVKE